MNNSQKQLIIDKAINDIYEESKTEFDKYIKDAIIYGSGYMMDGRHILYRDMLLVEHKCKKCNGAMKLSKAIEQTYTGLPDFPNDQYPVTLSPGGTGRLVDCLKCCECGWSISV